MLKFLSEKCSFGINQHSFTKSCKMLKFLSEKCSFGINQHSFTKSCKMLKFLSEKLEIILRINKRLITGRTVSLYSQPFCTSWCGYKMCDRLYLNDDVMGKGTRLSLVFFVMRSENDALLPWPFHQKVTLLLLDQDKGARHISDTFNPEWAVLD